MSPVPLRLLALLSPLLAATALYVVPFTAVRIVAEERVLLQGFGEAYGAFVRRVPALVPFAR